MSKWPIKKLGEICIINPKISFGSSLGNNTMITFVPMSAIDENTAKITSAEIRPYVEVSKGYTFFKENDVLFAKITPCMENGKTAIAKNLENGVGFGSTEFHVMRSKGEVLPQWVLAFLRRPVLRAAAKRSFTGSAGQQRVPIDFIENVHIPLPPLPEQEHIVSILDEAEEMKHLRAQANNRTADLIPALFDEMFGDPEKNEKEWVIRRFAEIVSKEKYSLMRGPFGGMIKKEIFVPIGYKVYEQRNAIQNDFAIGNYFIDEKKYKELEQFSVLPNDIIVSCSGTIGCVANVPEEAIPGIINQALMRIRIDQDAVNTRFVKELLNTDYIQREMFGSAVGSAIKNVRPLKEIRELKIPFPPIELQNVFAARVEEIHALESDQSVGKQKLESLFQSLLHSAFEGEL